MVVDSHCHLDFDKFDDDLEQVVARASSAHVSHMLTISTTLAGFDKVFGVADRFDNIFCSVGVHPHEAEQEPDTTAADLIERSRHPKVVGIGETGLDYYYDHSPRDIQKACFERHIEAAQETGLPLIVHTRDADEDMAEILTSKMAQKSYTGVLHCFSSSAPLAKAALEIGFYISFSGILTFKNAGNLRDIARGVPKDKLLVETDAPFLAPVPHRGKRNEPSFVVHTLDQLAELHGETADQMAVRTTDNFFSLFNKAKREGASS